MIYILNATKKFTPYEDQIKDSINKAIKKYKKITTLGPVDIVVADNPGMTIPGQGIGGYATSAHELYIPFDLSQQDITKIIATHLESTIAHELAHIIRLQAGIAFADSGSLADNIIGEGIADHMSLNLYKNQDAPWISALSATDLDKIKKRFLKDPNLQYYDHSAWFYGSDTDTIPHWSGYTLGFEIVKEYLQHTKKNPGEILTTPTDEILKMWQ